MVSLLSRARYLSVDSGGGLAPSVRCAIHLVYPLLKIRIEKVPSLPKKVKKSLIAIILDPATIGGHFCMDSLGLRVLYAFNPVLSPTEILTRKNPVSPSMFITCSSILDTKKDLLTPLLEMEKINSIADEKFLTTRQSYN